MGKSVEVTAKTVEQAIEKALAQLGVKRNEVECEVLDKGEPGGLLGFGRRPARVNVTILEESEDAFPQEDDSYTETDDLLSAEDKDEPVPSLEQGFAAAENAVLDYIEAILSGIGIHGSIESYADEEGQLHIEVLGSDCGAAIGRHGETLEALQYLANIVANRHVEEYLRVVVDVAGYRRRREEKVREMAERTARKVMQTAHEVKMRPMSAVDRRVVHLTLKDYPEVTTYSEGDAPYRYIVVAPSDGVEFVE